MHQNRTLLLVDKFYTFLNSIAMKYLLKTQHFLIQSRKG